MITQSLYTTAHDQESECMYMRTLRLPFVLAIGTTVSNPCFSCKVVSVTLYPDDEDNQIEVCLSDTGFPKPLTQDDWEKLHKEMINGGWDIVDAWGLALDAKIVVKPCSPSAS